MEEIGDKKLGFGYTLNSYLDHVSILSWINYMAHRCRVGKTTTNFDERDYVVLPSGQKVVITITIEAYQDEL